MLSWCNVGFAKDKAGHVYIKNDKHIILKERMFSLNDRTVAKAHCASLRKFAFQFFGDGVVFTAGRHTGKSASLVHCSNKNLILSPRSGGKLVWTNYDENHEFAQKGQEDKKFEKIEGYKKTCSALGFELGTDKFTDCTLKLFVADNKETTKIVESSSGVQEIIIRDPAREQRIRREGWIDYLNDRCEFSALSKNPCW